MAGALDQVVRVAPQELLAVLGQAAVQVQEVNMEHPGHRDPQGRQELQACLREVGLLHHGHVLMAGLPQVNHHLALHLDQLI